MLITALAELKAALAAAALKLMVSMGFDIKFLLYNLFDN